MARGPFSGELLRAQRLDNDGMKERMSYLEVALLREWGNAAAAKLNQTTADYIRGLRITNSTHKGFTCELRPRSALPFMVELGLGQGGIGTYTGAEYDMRPILFRSKRTRPGKKGRYLYVPFHKTAMQVYKGAPGALGVLLKQPMIKRTTRGQVSFSRSTSASSKIKPHHKSTALGGMYHIPLKKPYRAKSTVVGKLFRTASEAGQPWMTKGIKPRYIAEYMVKDYKVGDLLAGMF